MWAPVKQTFSHTNSNKHIARTPNNTCNWSQNEANNKEIPQKTPTTEQTNITVHTNTNHVSFIHLHDRIDARRWGIQRINCYRQCHRSSTAIIGIRQRRQERQHFGNQGVPLRRFLPARVTFHEIRHGATPVHAMGHRIATTEQRFVLDCSPTDQHQPHGHTEQPQTNQQQQQQQQR